MLHFCLHRIVQKYRWPGDLQERSRYTTVSCENIHGQLWSIFSALIFSTFICVSMFMDDAVSDEGKIRRWGMFGCGPAVQRSYSAGRNLSSPGRSSLASQAGHLHSAHCKLCLENFPVRSQNQTCSTDHRSNSEKYWHVSNCLDTHIQSSHPDVYQWTEHYHEIKGVPGIAKIILKKKS